MIPMEFFLVFGAALFVIGAYGVMTKTSSLMILMCIELMLNAANINLVCFAAFYGDAIGQVFVLMTLAVAAAEVGVGVAILMNAYKTKKTVNTEALSSMRW